ncbi:MAG: exo-beta-1,3-glucanase [Bacteroidia bacterium]|nr:exo-beta-1,3-glucanase [Bacteroidia bacterium]MBT8278924.1 exo-beta-1,3-glucanase [Bacteroidia bacterium]
MFKNLKISLLILVSLVLGCTGNDGSSVNAEDILGNPDYLAFSYGGYRQNTREIQPTIDELKDDMKILSAMGVKLIRTYNTNDYPQAANLLKAIHQLKEEDSNFEMYVMLGTWIECQGAGTNNKDHRVGNIEKNTGEIEAAIEMAKKYPDIVKIIAVGNEAMIQWAVKYFVYPKVILKWVNHLQNLKKAGELPSDLWITSSDNFESWGGGSKSYQTEDLVALIKAVDYISLHTYPFHDTLHNPYFWGTPEGESNNSDLEKVESAMLRATNHSITQYQNVANYISELGLEKSIHIGEIGWATVDNVSFGKNGTHAADELKQKFFYDNIRAWTNKNGITCFYFEIFDEKWKDAMNPLGSENHFGLINLKGQAKFAIWNLVDQGVFKGLTRNGAPISKTYGGDKAAMMADVHLPPLKSELGILEIKTINTNYTTGQIIKEHDYVILHDTFDANKSSNMTYPSGILKLNPWEGTCNMSMSEDKTIKVVTGVGEWWGCALEIQSGAIGENLSNFTNGTLNFDIKGTTKSSFNIGFQTGSIATGDQINNYITFGKDDPYNIKDTWTRFSIPITELSDNGKMDNINSLLFLKGDKDFDGKEIFIKNVHYSQK